MNNVLEKIPFLRGDKAFSVKEELPVDLQVELIEQDSESTDLSLYSNQAKAYGTFIWVYAAVNHIAESAAMVPFSVARRTGNDLVPETHPLNDLIMHPNHYMSRFELWERTFIHLELQGNVYWFIDLNENNVPVAIHIIRPHQMKPIPHKTKFVEFYAYTVNDRIMRIPANQIIHFKRYHPLKSYVGLSAIEASNRTLEMEDKRFKYDQSFFKNQARPDGLLTTDIETLMNNLIPGTLIAGGL